MSKFVEFIYLRVSFFDEPIDREIIPVKKWDVKAVIVPENAMGFKFIEAKSMAAAKRSKHKDLPIYYLTELRHVTTTDIIRKSGRLIDLFNNKLDDTVSKRNNNKKEYEDIEEIYQQSRSELLSKPAQFFEDRDVGHRDFNSEVANDMAGQMEELGCHRAIGVWPDYVFGISDIDIILDKETREVLFPAIKPV